MNLRKFSKLHHALVNRVKTTVAETGFPVFEADSEIQQGNNFGSRLCNAIEWVNQQGFDQIIILGNDSPGLTATQIREAAEKLNEGHSVLGKDHHGGAYLIALDIDKLDLKAFKDLSWQTSQVFSELAALLPKVEVLAKVFTDLNALSDLKTVIKCSELARSYARFLKSLVYGLATYTQRFFIILRSYTGSTSSHRGPPLLA